MQAPDTKPFPLVSAKLPYPRTSRSIKVRDYALPKPYRKKTFVEDEPRMSRLRIAVLTLSCLTIASLIAAVAMLARENLDAPPVLVIAAPAPEPGKQAAVTQLPGPVLAQVRAAVAAAFPATVQRVPQAPSVHAPGLLAAAFRSGRPPQPTPRPDAAPPDPDVDLVTVILTLSMASAAPGADPALAACTAGKPGDGGCPAIRGMEP